MGIEKISTFEGFFTKTSLPHQKASFLISPDLPPVPHLLHDVGEPLAHAPWKVLKLVRVATGDGAALAS